MYNFSLALLSICTIAIIAATIVIAVGKYDCVCQVPVQIEENN